MEKMESAANLMIHSSTFLLPSPPQSNGGPALTYAVVVLNQRLPSFAPLLWNHSKLRLCADGGANRIYDGMPELFPDQDPLDVRLRFKPDAIKGDMDSIRSEVKEHYTNLVVFGRSLHLLMLKAAGLILQVCRMAKLRCKTNQTCRSTCCRSLDQAHRPRQRKGDELLRIESKAWRKGGDCWIY